jgi:hypothetical protein
VLTRAETILALTREPGGSFELAPDQSSGYPMRIYRNAPASLRELLVATRSYGARPFLIYQDDTLSFAEHLSAPLRSPITWRALAWEKAIGWRSACATIRNGA